MRDTNSPHATGAAMPGDLEDRVMMALPAELRRWLQEEALDSICPRGVFQVWREGMPVPQILASLESIRRERTRRTYGWNHPQGALTPLRAAA